ncbi:unnamed protein product [Polarella glacialis]|uniref:Amino acid permease/ SLC12A domain-containing protein n=1 Tax=Polarella glacialis TaxID=89957 RepID=A0A813HQ69_POLGL|nr:unnamed protein product [Polarella glacialis]
MQAAATLNYAFIGYAVIANAAEECANPSRDIPRAITASLLTCAILYVSVSLVLCGMQSFLVVFRLTFLICVSLVIVLKSSFCFFCFCLSL